MAPFEEDSFYEQQEKDESINRPCLLWDYWKLGGRYAGRIKIDVSGDNAGKYDLIFYPKQKRVNRLFRSAFLESCNLDVLFTTGFDETDALCYMGVRDDIIYADSAKIEDVKEFPGGFGMILPSGEVFAREYWDGAHWIKCPDFDERKEAALSGNKDCWISVIDIHD